MTTRPLVDARDLLLAMQEAVWLTFLIDLHLLERRDPELAEAAENLGWAVQELEPVWPRSLADASTTVRLLPTWKYLRHEADGMQERARTIHRSLARMEPEAIDSDAITRQQRSSPEWAEAAEQNREPLIEVWRLLIEAVDSDAICPPRFLTDQQLSKQLEQIREDLIPALSLSADPHRQPRAFLDRLGKKLPEPLARHLTRRIADSWRVQNPRVKKAIREASKRQDKPHRTVKEDSVRKNLWPPMDTFSRPQQVRIGQQYQRREHTPVRAVSSRTADTEGTRKWAESNVWDEKPTQDFPPARLWPGDLPVYRTWKWIVNKVIGTAKSDVVSEYGETDDLATGADSLDAPQHRTGTESDGERTLHEEVGESSSGRQLEALIAQEKLEAVIERVGRMLDVGSPQQREIVLAKLDPELAPSLNEQCNLSHEEQQLAEANCGSWREVAKAAGVPSKGQAHRQYRRCEEKLEDD